jgi:hypothetical protein
MLGRGLSYGELGPSHGNPGGAWVPAWSGSLRDRPPAHAAWEVGFPRAPPPSPQESPPPSAYRLESKLSTRPAGGVISSSRFAYAGCSAAALYQ